MSLFEPVKSASHIVTGTLESAKDVFDAAKVGILMLVNEAAMPLIEAVCILCKTFRDEVKGGVKEQPKKQSKKQPKKGSKKKVA
tara:strand:- start:472 stop:723 length:252 start_codon:yes stop_codon:yes gene_type:complete